MSVTIKAFPTEIGEYIELPDIAELLTYPFFCDNYVEDIYKYGSEFQRYLIDKTPLKHDKKFISCRCQVKYVYPTARPVTGYSIPFEGRKPFEWHIDSDENLDLFYRPNDRVHLLTSKTNSMTDFNKNEFTMDFDYTRGFNKFILELQDHYNQLIIPQAMEPNRIITFSNHLHRATAPPTHEFRFIYRVVETDRDRKPGHTDNLTMNNSNVYDIQLREYINTITKNNDKINLQWKRG